MTTITQHTPGPWIIQRSRTIRPNYALICGQDWHDLANVVVRFSGDKGDDDTGLANAALIAAAPDMQAALKLALEALNVIPNHIIPGRVGGSYAVASLIEKALAKAEGR